MADEIFAESGARQRKQTIRVTLDTKLIKSLDISKVPVGLDGARKLIFRDNPRTLPDGSPNPAFDPDFFVWDGSQAAPPGFGVRISNKKTYVLRRKVHGKSLLSKVGNFADFVKIEDARVKAAGMALCMEETGRNPNEVQRELWDGEPTLGRAFQQYKNHLQTRAQKRASPETLKVVNRVVKRFEEYGWLEMQLRDIDSTMIQERFNAGREKTPVANEQAFQFAFTAVKWCMGIDQHDASLKRRAPALIANPFTAIYLLKLVRSNAERRRGLEEQSKRNPLGPSTTLGRFLEVAWSKKNTNDNETGVHYLILMLLWGCRKSEHAGCVWAELLHDQGGPGVGRRVTPHIELRDDPTYGPYVFFYETKNTRSHRLPIAPFARELLLRRQASAAEEASRRGFASKSRAFVFPARSRFSKSGHYSDAAALLASLRGEAGLEKLNRHDLRRTFGAVTTSLGVPPRVVKAFLNHAGGDVTDDYTMAEWALLRDWMSRIEQAIMSKAPNVYNSLKPADWPLIPAPEPHVCKPAAPRSGRPRKATSVTPVAGIAQGESGSEAR